MSEGLLPSAAPAGTIRIDRELPKAARDWGRIIDFTALEAGDLLLFRPVNPAADSISRRIRQAQADGGLHRRHAQWTHAAVYLGDGEHICEANFKVPGQPDGVTLRSGFEYCDGGYAIRARRLYQDAYNFAFQGAGVRMGSLCTPAHLSASSDFEQNEPNLQWLEIV
jgi:hypothetical protein